MKTSARPTKLVLVVGLLVLATTLRAQPQQDRFFWPSYDLSEQERKGEFLFLQNCAICHLPRLDKSAFASRLPAVYQSLEGLFRGAAPGKDENVRETILKGSVRMPGFQYTLEPNEIDDLIAYLKTR